LYFFSKYSVIVPFIQGAMRAAPPITISFDCARTIEGAAISAQIGHAGPVADARSNKARALAPVRFFNPIGMRFAKHASRQDIDDVIAALPALTAPGGRAVVISFHSLEDRLVKQAFRAGLQDGIWEEVARKPVIADEAETAANPRANPAKLRWAVRAAEVAA
jgi:hypothetical protein